MQIKVLRRTFSKITKGFKKANNVVAWLVPGSHRVLDQIKSEGILEELESSGFKVREPGCSACLAMNDDKIPPGKYVISTSNRNFEGRQGPGGKNNSCKSSSCCCCCHNR